MKTFSAIILTLCILTSVFSGCKKDDSATPEKNSVTAKINGVSFSSDTVICVVGSGSMSFTSVSGEEKIILYIPETATVGNHPLNYTTYNILYFDKLGAIYSSQGGSIRISKNDAAGKTIEGTFAETMYNGAANKTMTDGVFKIKY
jgi:hypothetical protein